MATRTYIGAAPKIAGVQNYLLAGTWEATDVILFTMGTVTFTLVAGSTNTTTIAALMATTWNALSATAYPQFSELTASSSTGNFILTADTAGNAFTCTISTTETGGGAADAQTIDGGASSTGTVTTANSGPGDWSNAANWAEGAVPVDADAVVIDRGAFDIIDGLNQTAIELLSLDIKASFTGTIGRPKQHPSLYPEYRTDYLVIAATTINIGYGSGNGSGRIKLNCEAEAITLNVYSTGTSKEQGLPSVQFKGTNAANVVNVYNGDVGIATFSGETSTVVTLRQSGGIVNCSSGVTLTTIDKVGGTLFTDSAATTVTNAGGDATLNSGAHTTITVREGSLKYNSTGTITTLTVYAGATADFRGINKARTVTNAVVTAGATVRDPNRTVTVTNGWDLYQCGLSEVTLDIGENFTLTPSNI
jgi:hypothetical protein